jgi:hypothetical protein
VNFVKSSKLKMIQRKNWEIWAKFTIVDAFLVILAIFTEPVPSHQDGSVFFSYNVPQNNGLF